MRRADSSQSGSNQQIIDALKGIPKEKEKEKEKKGLKLQLNEKLRLKYEVMAMHTALSNTILRMNALISRRIQFVPKLMTEDELIKPWDYRKHCSPLSKVDETDLICRWVNFQIDKIGGLLGKKGKKEKKFKFDDFSLDIRDSRVYWTLLLSLGLITKDELPSEAIGSAWNREKAISEFISVSIRLNLNSGAVLRKSHIENGRAEPNFVFLARLLSLRPGLEIHRNDILDLFGKANGCLEESERCFSLNEELQTKKRLKEMARNMKDVLDEIESCLRLFEKLDDEFSIIRAQILNKAVAFLSAHLCDMPLIVKDAVGKKIISTYSTLNPSDFSQFYVAPSYILQSDKHLSEVIEVCEVHLSESVKIVSQIFETYAARGGDITSLDDLELKQFLEDLKVAHLSTIQPLMERSIRPHDFPTFLAEICWARIEEFHWKRHPFHRRFQTFLESLWNKTKISSQIKELMILPKVENYMEPLKKKLKEIFENFAYKKEETADFYFDKRKWKRFLQKYGVFEKVSWDRTHENLIMALFDAANGDYGQVTDNAAEEMVFPEFLEALVAYAFVKNPNCYVPIHVRIKSVLDPVLSQGLHPSAW